MMGAEALLTIAEIGVAFAGFATVASALLQRSDKKWAAEDAMRFQQLIFASLAVLFYSLLPFAMDLFGVPETLNWRVCSGLLGLVTTGASVGAARRTLSLVSGGKLSATVAATSFLLLLVATTFQVLNAVSIGFSGEVAPYFAGLLCLLALAGIALTDTVRRLA